MIASGSAAWKVLGDLVEYLIQGVRRPSRPFPGCSVFTDSEDEAPPLQPISWNETTPAGLGLCVDLLDLKLSDCRHDDVVRFLCQRIRRTAFWRYGRCPRWGRDRLHLVNSVLFKLLTLLLVQGAKCRTPGAHNLKREILPVVDSAVEMFFGRTGLFAFIV